MTFEEALKAMNDGDVVSNERFNYLWLADYGRSFKDMVGNVVELSAKDKKSEHWRIRRKMVNRLTGELSDDLYDPTWPDPDDGLHEMMQKQKDRA